MLLLGGIGEGNQYLKGINSNVTESEVRAQLISEVVFEGEVVKGTDEVTNPVTHSEEEVVGVVDTQLEVNWEHGGESFLGEGGEEKNESEELSNHLGVTGIGALKFWVSISEFWVERGCGWFRSFSHLFYLIN